MVTADEFVELVKSKGFVRVPGLRDGETADAYHNGFFDDTEAPVLITIKVYPNSSFTAGYHVGGIKRKPMELIGQFSYGESTNTDARRILEILKS